LPKRVFWLNLEENQMRKLSTVAAAFALAVGAAGIGAQAAPLPMPALGSIGGDLLHQAQFSFKNASGAGDWKNSDFKGWMVGGDGLEPPTLSV
jgi:hypothetical protein